MTVSCACCIVGERLALTGDVTQNPPGIHISKRLLFSIVHEKSGLALATDTAITVNVKPHSDKEGHWFDPSLAPPTGQNMHAFPCYQCNTLKSKINKLKSSTIGYTLLPSPPLLAIYGKADELMVM